MLEAEEAFVDTTEQLAARIDDMVRVVTKNLLNTCDADIRSSSSSADAPAKRLNWIKQEFPRMTYAEACNILSANRSRLNHHFDPSKGLNREQELFMVNHVQGPLFIIDWPKNIKPFYMRQSAENPDLVNGNNNLFSARFSKRSAFFQVEALDFLVPGVGELAGGSLREDNYELLKQNLPSENLQWYLDLRKYGGCRSAGFGLGFERYLQLITGISSIKDVIPFPRWIHHCVL